MVLNASSATGMSAAGPGIRLAAHEQLFDFNTALGADRPGKVVPFDTPEAQFRKFLLEHGLLPRAVVPTDGARVERCPVEGDSGNKNPAGTYFSMTNFPPANAATGKLGECWTWCAKRRTQSDERRAENRTGAQDPGH